MRLSLTSPHTKNNHVKALQRALKKNNYLQGAIDGEFGPDTARAVYRAKYWLGYRKPDQYAGDYLYELLTGSAKPNLAMKAIRANRVLLAKRRPIRLKMWDEAGKWLGTKENPPNSNIVFFSKWYGLIGAWCAMAVSYCGTIAGSKVFKRGKYYAYVPYMVADARAGRNGLAITYDPQMGDIVCYDWDKDGIADHTGLFGEWLTRSGDFFAREGNTSKGNNSNGGEYQERHDRHKSEVIAFIHVGR